MKVSRRTLLTATALLPLSACAVKGGAESLDSDVRLLDLPLETAGTMVAATASQRLAWAIITAEQGNTVISPSSLVSAIAMVGEGAQGTSERSLNDVFGLAGNERSAAVGALRQALASYDSLPEKVDADAPPASPIVHQEARVLVIGRHEVKQPFLERVASYYGTATDRVALEDAKPNLDAWARKHTAGLIEQSGIEPDEQTQLVLQDALLFAAAWRTQFELSDNVLFEENTVPGVSGTLNVPSARGGGWSAVRLPYDEVLAMDVILPDNDPRKLTADLLEEVSAALRVSPEQSIEVTMPSLDLATMLDLASALPGVGIDLTDLSGIADDARLGQVAQQVKLQVNAKGTVGAALTEVAVLSSAPELPQFIVNRPYVVRVLDTRTGWPLFLAIITDPRG